MKPFSDSGAKNAGIRAKASVSSFTRRVSEGRNLDELWKQFAADASAGYNFYGRDVGWEEIQDVRGWRRPFRITSQLFWAVLSKMSPARRVVLLLAFALAFLGYAFILPIVLLVLLFMELADKVTMKRDLEIAREIQTWLVPANPPAVAGAEIAFFTRPQNSVAGDYYDAFYMDAADPDGANGSKLMMVIADVAGKSIPAALLMATLQASLRTIAGDGAPLADLVARLNRYAAAHSQSGQRFTTAVLCEYDPQSRVLTYVNAGHNAPILRRADGQLEKLEVGGLPLGIHAPVDYDTASLELQPGDALIFYTDGVIEAFNKDLQEFGNERWCNTIRGLPILNAQESLQFLMKPVDEFVGATRQSDDITYLVFRCNQGARKMPPDAILLPMQADQDVVNRWSKSAQFWEKHREVIRGMFEPVTQALIQDAEIGAGQTVLDIATGPGEPALSLTGVVGPAGKVCGIDPIPGMIDGARRAAASLELRNVDFEVAFADQLPFPADKFDAIICRFGAMFFLAPADAVREILRVLKPGRKFALAVWHVAEKNPFHRTLSKVLDRHAPSPPPEPDALDAFRFATPGKLLNFVKASGVANASERLLQFNITAPISPEDFWAIRMEMSTSLRDKIAALSPGQLTAVTQEFVEALREYSTSQGLSFPGEVLIVSGTKAP